MEASDSLALTGEAAPGTRAQPLLCYEDELLFAADPRRCGAVFVDPVLRLVRSDGASLPYRLPYAARAALFASDPAAEKGFSRGDVVYAILDEAGALLHHSFVQRAAAVLPLLGEAGAAPLIGRCATAAAARGRRLYPRTLRHIMAELAATGEARAVIYCDRDNQASIRGIRHAGFAQVAHLRTLILGGRWALQRRNPGGVRLIAL